MFAIVKIGAHQYRVSPGDSIRVDHIEGKVGDITYLPALLVVEGGNVRVGKEVRAVKIPAIIKSHGKGEKIDTYRFKAKSRYRKHRGFRTFATTLEIKQWEESELPQKPLAKRRISVKRKK